MNETNKPFLMNKRNFLHVANTKDARDVAGDDFIPITLEEAKALDQDRKSAGLKILRAAVAADNKAALDAAETSASGNAVQTSAHVPSGNISDAIAERDAEIERLKAEVAAQRKEKEIAERKAVAPAAPATNDPDEMSYDELKAAAAARGIDLGKTPRKLDLIAALKAAGDAIDGNAGTTDTVADIPSV